MLLDRKGNSGVKEAVWEGTDPRDPVQSCAEEGSGLLAWGAKRLQTTPGSERRRSNGVTMTTGGKLTW